MKLIFALVATLIAFSAQANDRKIGNVIAVERQITNLYENCLSNISTDVSKEQTFFYCNISYLKSPLEMPVTKGGVIRFNDQRCRVDAEAGNGVLILSFGRAKGSVSDFATAKTCLQRALQNSNSVSVLVYTME
ncbi:hypothetical protein [Bdellovibrio svalbardensis]|uniref:Uncharacterized protein n=1 Tax=Bdellovibrio svalbardensis TaxID=2972972 RepID=A0ABT6DK31_9BACT|nr:hypothetical protein [Bdellovibrio svalbardensis]MDG0816894.1 hypothetical protein [Bdellovibrio svalbardensis]